jgi:hypothetical protein
MPICRMLVSVIHDFSLFASERYPKKEELGTFLVEKCEAGKESYTQMYNSRVTFV